MDRRIRYITLAANPFLFLLEYFLKFLAGVTGVIVLGAPGTFFSKLGTGFGSLSGVVNSIRGLPERLTYTGSVIHDYNTLTASAFNSRYGGQAVNGVMEYLNEWVLYSQSVYQNLAQQPVATITATLIAFLLIWFLARTVRFVRQRGRGSWLVRKERQVGNRVFRRYPE